MASLILGTATFGTGYGVANNGLILSDESVREIIVAAQCLGITEFDTAPAYGNAESKLGEFLNYDLAPMISSKISKENTKTVKLMLESVKNTLKRTRASKLRNLYLHDPDALFGKSASEVIAGFTELLASGLVDRIGASVYSIESILKSKEIFPELTVFQVPENICDRRVSNSKEMAVLASNGNHFIVRSIFLQGLLLMPLSDIPEGLEKSKSVVAQLIDFANMHQVSRLDLCLSYAQGISWAEEFVIGATSVSQLQQILKSKFELPTGWQSKIGTIPEEILDPRRW